MVCTSEFDIGPTFKTVGEGGSRRWRDDLLQDI